MNDNLLAVQAQTAYANTKAAPPHVGKNLNTQQARKVSQEYEAVFLTQMLQPMFAKIKAEEPFGGGSGSDIWRSMQVEEFGKAMARSGSIGLADSIYQQIIKMQEAQ
jgi:Rod binding domain-containing protein